MYDCIPSQFVNVKPGMGWGFVLFAYGCTTISKLFFLHQIAFAPLWKSIGHISVSLFLNSLFCSIDLYVYTSSFQQDDFIPFLHPQGHLAISWDNFDCHNSCVIGILWAEAGDTIKHTTIHGTTPNNKKISGPKCQ